MKQKQHYRGYWIIKDNKDNIWIWQNGLKVCEAHGFHHATRLIDAMLGD